MTNHANPINRKELILGIGQAAEIIAREFPDVTISSLRFLEREGLISPSRNTGGRRVFTEQDLLRVRRIKQLQAERLSLKEIGERLERWLVPSDLDRVVDEIASMLLEGNIRGAVSRLEDVHHAEMPLLTIFDDVLTPALRNLGDNQSNHLIPVDLQLEFDEQLISFISRITYSPAEAIGQPVILAACPPWERHDLPLRMLVALLVERGASVHFIGAQVDSEFARDANRRLQPDVILISMTVPASRVARQWFSALMQSMTLGQVLIIGGLGAQGLNIANEPNVEVMGLTSYAEMVRRILSSRNKG